MVNAQEWLDENYPREKRSATEKIYINQQLEGELDLADFSQLEYIHIFHSLDETKWEIKNLESLFPKIKSEKAQDWLNRKYSNKEAVKEIEMNIAKEQIEGELKIAEFPQLEKIEVTNGYLTKLLIINCPQLIKLDCSNSLLSEQSHLKITGCPKLEKLICAGNFISHLDVREVGNLKELNCSDNNLHFSSLNDILNRAD